MSDRNMCQTNIGYMSYIQALLCEGRDETKVQQMPKKRSNLLCGM